MGNNQVAYSKYVSEKKPGESQILRSLFGDENGNLVTTLNGKSTIREIFKDVVERNPNKEYLGTRERLEDIDGKPQFGQYKWKTYQECYEDAESMAKFLVTGNHCPKVKSEDGNFSMIGLYAKNRQEWVITDLAASMAGYAVVTLYDTLGKEFTDYILNQTELRTLVLQPDKISLILDLKEQNKLPYLKTVIYFDELKQTDQERIDRLDLDAISFSEALKLGKEQTNVKFDDVNGDTIYTVCYTSGTTGPPKGVLSTNLNFVCQMASFNRFCPDFQMQPEDIYLSYLPLSHSFERCLYLVMTAAGVQYGFYQGDVLKLREDLQELKPTIIISVPRLLTRFYDLIQDNIRSQTGFKRTLLDWGLAKKIYNIEQHGKYNHFFYDKVFSRCKDILGGRVRLIITGSAPISKDVLSFLQAVFCCPILNGYGQTEGAAPSSITWMYDPEVGHAGPPYPSNEIKLIDVPEMNYTSEDVDDQGRSTPRGEVLYRGANVFKGYYKNKQATMETLDKDGWVHTGDIGVFLPGGRLKIIDRKKNIFKLSQGEYVLPDRLESKYAQSPYIAQNFIYGDSLQNYLVGIIVPDQVQLQKWQNQEENKDISGLDYESLLKHEKTKNFIKEEIKKKAKEAQFVGYEIPMRVHLTSTAFTVENNLLTTTFKFKRFEGKNMFIKEIKEMYDGAKLLGDD